MEKKIHIIDAEGKRLGRVATEAASFLIGKNTPGFQRHILTGSHVRVINVSKADINEKRTAQKTYASYSGYPGGLKLRKAKAVIAKHGFREIFSKAIYGMLPSNRLRALRMKNLDIVE